VSVLLAARTAHDVARPAARPYTSQPAYLLAAVRRVSCADRRVHERQTTAPVSLHAHLAAASRTAALRSGPSFVMNGHIRMSLSVLKTRTSS